jgi:D-3-phosphoglycerate dehydrogenase / 2-oxoglutarate reductase
MVKNKSKSMNILHLEAYNYSAESLNALRTLGRLEIAEPKNSDELNTLLSNNNFDIIFTTIGNPLNRENLKNQIKLKAIVTPTTGLNHIDLDFANEKKIEVISLKGEFEFLNEVQSTAEHTWMLLLSIARKAKQAQANIQNRIWDRTDLLSDELNTKTIGIIGYGRLGKILVRYAKAFSMKILVSEINPVRQKEALENGIQICELNELLTKSDYVILLVDYNSQNEKLIGTEAFNLMKESAFFINTSRGELVDEQALLYALKRGDIKGAALDVLKNDSEWKREIPANNELVNYSLTHSNLIITPHIGGYGKVSILKTRDFITEKFLNYIN